MASDSVAISAYAYRGFRYIDWHSSEIASFLAMTLLYYDKPKQLTIRVALLFPEYLIILRSANFS